MTYRYEELERMYDGRIPQNMLDMADGMGGAAARKREQLRTLVATMRRDARRAFKTLRDVHTGRFTMSFTPEQAYDWQARALINAREAFARYRVAQFQLRAAEGRMVRR